MCPLGLPRGRGLGTDRDLTAVFSTAKDGERAESRGRRSRSLLRGLSFRCVQAVLVENALARKHKTEKLPRG